MVTLDVAVPGLHKVRSSPADASTVIDADQVLLITG